MSTEVQMRLSKSMPGGDEGEAQPAEDRFVERRRIILMETDAKLRSVMVRTLLHLGCVVRFKHSLDAVAEAMQDGLMDGAVVALDADVEAAVRLQAVNQRQIPLVILVQKAPDPRWNRQMPEVRFLEKPFDMRELCALLGLPPQARIAPAR